MYGLLKGIELQAQANWLPCIRSGTLRGNFSAGKLGHEHKYTK